MEKLISIIIPAYNAEKYIARCLDSIIKQADEKIEVIIVNDGSKDNTKDICEDYHKQYDFINVINQPNGGVSVARNTGIERASGEYLFFLDADDMLADGAMAWAVNNIDENDTLYCGSFNYLKTRGRIQPYRLPDLNFDLEHDYVDEIINTIPNAPWGKLYNRKIVEEYGIRFPKGIPYAEDTIFLLEYLKHIRFVKSTSEIIYNYNFTDSGSAMWRYYPDFYKYIFAVMDRKKQLCDVKNVEYRAVEDKEKNYKRCINHYMRNGHRDRIGDVINEFGFDYNPKEVIDSWLKSNWKDYIIYNIKKKIM